MSRFLLSGLALGLGLATVAVAQDPGGDSVKVDARDKESSGKTDQPLVAGTAKVDQTQTLPVRRIKVDTVKMLAPNCR